MFGSIEKRGNWGWCLHCERAIDPEIFWGIGESDDHWCPFDGCDGGGIGIDLYEVDPEAPKQGREAPGMIPETWPETELPVHGKRYPLYKGT